jgi:hypothetical protein
MVANRRYARLNHPAGQAGRQTREGGRDDEATGSDE